MGAGGRADPVRRSAWDPCLASCACYSAAGLRCLAMDGGGVGACAMLQLTALGAGVYHRHRERHYVAFDQCFAMACGLYVLSTFALAARAALAGNAHALGTLPWLLLAWALAVTFLIFCGFPYDPCLRSGSGTSCGHGPHLHGNCHYDTWHSVWHAASAAAMVATCAVLRLAVPGVDHGAPFIDPSPGGAGVGGGGDQEAPLRPLLPLGCLAVAVAVNRVTNLVHAEDIRVTPLGFLASLGILNMDAKGKGTKGKVA